MSIWVSLVLSVVAIVLSIASLAWQVMSFKLSGPVVKVAATQAMPTYDEPAGGQRLGDWHVMVTAHNSGRSPVTVNSWGLRLPGGQTMIMRHNLPWSTPLQHRLEPGSDGNWFIATEDIMETCAEQGIRHQDLTAFVNLADGRTVDAKGRGIGLK